MFLFIGENLLILLARGLAYCFRDDLYALRRKYTLSHEVQLIQLWKVHKDFGTLSICK